MSGDTRVIAVDLGGTKIAAGVVARSGEVERERERPTPLGSEEELLAALEDAVEQLLDERIGALGVGIPSRIDQRAGVAEGSTNIPLEGEPVRDRLRDRFGLPVALENDANAAALAEWKIGAGRGTRDMVMLTLGTGVGGGVVVGGRPFRGWAEFGHLVVLYDGPPCQGTCTGRGHLESLASGHAAGAAARRAFGPDADARLLVRLADDGDARACEVLAEIGRFLGAGIGSLVNIFRPEVVVIGGGFASAGEHLLASAREIVAREALTPAGTRVRIVRAELEASGLVGAGLIGFEALDAGQ
jgi:glucokinase